jgi:hypothetical protein
VARLAFKMKMSLRPLLLSVMLLALAANPCFAKDGHAHHGARASAANNGASGNGASGGSRAPSKAVLPIDAEAPVAPPVLPPRGITQQKIRTINPSVKTVNPQNSSRSQTGATTITTPTARNAIGQPVVSPKNFSGAEPPSPALQKPGAVSPPITHGAPGTPGAVGGPAAPPVSSRTARANAANATNRGSVNGTTVIRPATGPSVIGGPAQARYGINGTTVQNRH